VVTKPRKGFYDPSTVEFISFNLINKVHDEVSVEYLLTRQTADTQVAENLRARLAAGETIDLAENFAALHDEMERYGGAFVPFTADVEMNGNWDENVSEKFPFQPLTARDTVGEPGEFRLREYSLAERLEQRQEHRHNWNRVGEGTRRGSPVSSPGGNPRAEIRLGPSQPCNLEPPPLNTPDYLGHSVRC